MTEREYVPLPRYDEDTPVGRMSIITRGGASEYVHDEREHGPRPLRTVGAMTLGAEHGRPASVATINGVDYSLRVELADYGDGWTLARERGGSDYHAISGMRADWGSGGRSYNDAHLSPAAWRKVRDVLVPWLVDWIESHPDAMAAGVHASREQAARGLERAIEQKEQELADLRARLADVLA